MPDVILRILSIIGIVLLILLGLVLLSLLLVLFWPVTYRVKGEKNAEKLWVTARADWLFGFLRVRYAYPEPGTVTVKLLWKTLADTKKAPPAENTASTEVTASTEAAGTEEGTGAERSPEAAEGTRAENRPETEGTPEAAEGTGAENCSETEGTPEAAEGTGAENCSETEGTPEAADAEETVRNKLLSRFSEKIRKIKYTILKIYDKIKEIWANITYYIALLREEDTALLWGHVKLRLGKILKNIRPRRVRANVLFGTGAPDTTGCLFGVYGMLLPVLGKNVCVTPDFSRAVLEGNVDVSGHITLCTLAWNALKLLLDKKLQLFIKKMKAGRKENGR